MKQVCDGFEFDFPDALSVFIFDERNRRSTYYHGFSHGMKAVDLIVELEDRYLFIEIKDFHEPDRYQEANSLNTLRGSLKTKYRDTWLYRWAEERLDKPIQYFCLLELRTPLLPKIANELRKQIPVGKATDRWKREICSACHVLNVEIWNRRFTNWPIIRTSEDSTSI